MKRMKSKKVHNQKALCGILETDNLGCLPYAQPFTHLYADEHSEDEEPATTSADDEATKKATTEQQKQLSKKVSLLFSSATPHV